MTISFDTHETLHQYKERLKRTWIEYDEDWKWSNWNSSKKSHSLPAIASLELDQLNFAINLCRVLQIHWLKKRIIQTHPIYSVNHKFIRYKFIVPKKSPHKFVRQMVIFGSAVEMKIARSRLNVALWRTLQEICYQ